MKMLYAIIILLISILLLGCAANAPIAEKTVDTQPIVTEQQPVQPDDYTDIQTADDDFDAIDSALDELE
ncbi:MAG TPA: hypothetical protein VJH88_02960 [Candidatus Nanoarchaeia archaeon]|nr:hypothetical protein [Candidatus Nanoarchaeia archaeon]